jgi:hypothetical protein
MEVMKRLVCLLFASGVVLAAADLSGVHAVYLFPMSRGMDQYLANRLTNDHVFRVVTDPKLADAFFSDRLGDAFQAELDAALPKPAPPKDAAKDAKDDSKPASKSRSSATGMFSDTVNKLDNPSMNSSFGRGKGNVFLVDAKSRQVVWSTFDPAKDDTVKQLDRTASDIVNRIKKDLNPGMPGAASK